MCEDKNALLRAIEARATCRLGRLAGELVRAESEDKEPILADLEFQRWLAESCLYCQRIE